MDHPTTPTVAHSTAPAPTLIKHGAGVGTAIGLAISWCIALGLGSTWWTINPSHLNTILFAAGGMVATIAVAAACGAVIGWSIPVVETKTDSTATH